MTGLAKAFVVIILLLVLANLFLLFEIHKINGTLAANHASINQLMKNTSQNQKDINNLQDALFHIYSGG